MIAFNITSIPLPYRFILGPPSQTIMNIMACRVYRTTRLGLLDRPVITSPSELPQQPNAENKAHGPVAIEFVSEAHTILDIEMGVADVEKKQPSP